MRYNYQTQGVCARAVSFDLDGNVVTNVVFSGGCPGNTKAVAILVDGMTVETIEEKLRGNTCGYKPTSCADQLAIAVRAALDKESAEK